MSPERLYEIEWQLRRHPNSPNTIPLALELVEALRGAMSSPPPEQPVAAPVVAAPLQETEPAPAVTPPEPGKRSKR